MSDSDYAHPDLWEQSSLAMEPDADLRRSFVYTALVREREATLSNDTDDEGFRPEFKTYSGFEQLTATPPANPSGISPVEFKVLVLPDPVEEVTKGGIIVPIEKLTKDEYATTTGTIIAASPAAFSHITDAEWQGTKPKVGDHIVFTRYAGFRIKSKHDGKDYVIIKDQDIHARFED